MKSTRRPLDKATAMEIGAVFADACRVVTPRGFEQITHPEARALLQRAFARYIRHHKPAAIPLPQAVARQFPGFQPMPGAVSWLAAALGEAGPLFVIQSARHQHKAQAHDTARDSALLSLALIAPEFLEDVL